MAQEYRVSGETNWPLVAGVGILAAVSFYILYIVNDQLQQADQLIGGTASDIQDALSPITNTGKTLGNWITGIGNWFSSLGGGGTGFIPAGSGDPSDQ